MLGDQIQVNVLLLVGMIVMMRDMPFKFVDKQRCPFCTTPLVANRIFDLYFIENGTIVELDKKGVAD